MSGQERPRVGRTYTAARRHPWVLGKLGDWQIPLGPYTPAQITVAFVGAFVLIKTFAWWSWLGPLPIVALGVAVWAVRGARIAGRTPLAALFGWVALCCQPAAGRLGGRNARDRSPCLLQGGFVIEPPVQLPPPRRRQAVPAPAHRPRGQGRRQHSAAPATTGVRPRSALQQLLETHERRGS